MGWKSTIPRLRAPLTPALSPSEGERVNRRQRLVQSRAAPGIRRWPAVAASIAAWLFWVAGATPLYASELRIERLFGPETKTGPYKHPARIEERRNGDLYAAYYYADPMAVETRDGKVTSSSPRTSAVS